MHTLRGRLSAVVLACAALLGHAFATARRAVDDENLERAVETRISQDVAGPADLVAATARDGIVTLEGWTGSLPLKERAERAAERTRGVRAVVNRIRVEPTVDRTPAELRRAVSDALRSAPTSGARAVRTAVDAGHVTLTGSVTSWAAKRSVGQLTKGVAGVKAVDNRIEVQYPPRPLRVG